MRFEFDCICGVRVATENEITEDIPLDVLEATHNGQVAMHISRCRKALGNYMPREIKDDE